MCGISGFVYRDGERVSFDIVKKMTDLIVHRGPDGDGYITEGNVALGHRRLAILDLSDGGQQPMHYGDNSSIVYNGEIYNYKELKTELRDKGYEFRTGTDTEVILAAYDNWGEDCVRHFNGMWAFCIFDRARGRLFCSRDRFGIKPFYYFLNNDIFAFGSEIRQLLPFLGKVKENESVLLNFLVTGISDNGSETFFEGVQKLSPSHNLSFDLTRNQMEIVRYYEVQRPTNLESNTDSSWISKYGEMLKSAVALRLRSDVRVGTCLSGGLDSSSVATIASELCRESGETIPFSAITAVSELPENDESEFAKMVVDAAQLDWHTVRPNYQDFARNLENVVQAQEEPFGSASICMQYFVMRTAHENGLKVLLDGQGGDETLLGYERYYAAHFMSTFRKEGMRTAFRGLWECRKNNSKMTLRMIAFYLVGGLLANARYQFYKRRHSYLRHFPPMPDFLSAFARASTDSFAIQKLEIEETNLPMLLRFEDKNSMWHSVETRLPFLDYRTLETALRVPGDLKIHQGWTKWILRKVMDGRMPETVAWRKNKLGFEAPDKLWMKQHAREIEREISNSKLLEKHCDMDVLKRCIDTLDLRTRWRLFSIAIWERIFSVEVA